NRRNNHASNLRWATSTEQKLNQAKRKPSTHKVYQYDLDNQLVKIWPSVKIASESTKIPETALHKCCKENKGTTWLEYTWKYEYNTIDISDEKWEKIPLEGFNIFYASTFGRIKSPSGEIKPKTLDQCNRYKTLAIADIEGNRHHIDIHRLVA